MTVYTGSTFQTCALRIWGIWVSMRDFRAATVRYNRELPQVLRSGALAVSDQNPDEIEKPDAKLNGESCKDTPAPQQRETSNCNWNDCDSRYDSLLTTG
jgi:hypothetical protein